ncbi:MAG TPA: response regulator transcription factor [Candidatus Limnocylindrales bacterium]|jgi:DNA-binding response OmpR family regulator
MTGWRPAPTSSADGIQARTGAPILVVDDDPKIVRLVTLYLERAGFEVIGVGDGRSALEALAADHPALVVLDVMLPGIDGLTMLDAIRHAGDTPVVMLSARGTADDRIAGLAGGADDYVAKPFSPAELVLRVSRVLERTRRGAARDPAPLRLGDLEVDEARHLATITGRPVDLTAIEFRLLAAIIGADGRVLSRARILDLVYGAFEGDVMDRTIDVHIGRLREKLGDAPTSSRYIVTVRGLGYRAGTSVEGRP